MIENTKERCDTCQYKNDFEYHPCVMCNNEKDMYRKKQTRADRMRSMTDEGIAEMFTQFWYDGPKFSCPVPIDIGDDGCEKQADCRSCFLEWLRGTD